MTPQALTFPMIHEPFATYLAKGRDFLTSHQLKDFRKCPLLYWKRRQGLIADEDRPAFCIGRAAHTLILEGREAFERAYAVGGPINPKTQQPFGQATKAFADWAARQGKPVLTDEQFDLVSFMNAGVRAHEGARGLLEDGVAESVVRTDYHGLPCQIRMDWFNPFKGIVDLKTCDDLTWFESDARRYQYTHQLAFYRAVLAQVTGKYIPVHMMAIEKKEPYRCGVWKLDESTLNQAQKENEGAMDRLLACAGKNLWPSGYEETRVLDAI